MQNYTKRTGVEVAAIVFVAVLNFCVNALIAMFDRGEP